MDVRGIANSLITTVNPNISAVLLANDGYTVTDSGKQIPKYTEHEISVQLQSLSTQDLEHLGVINQQGQHIYAYARGQISAIRRTKQKGSDRMRFAAYGEEDEVSEWNVTKVIESYPTWVKVLLWRQ
ncbi:MULTISPECIES: hypothetical protein [Xenorhabdus]|uniref:hypothetical protein n=1 Tax=Xenorhabdus TaxID=626 RepID=UPI00064B47C3|nr:MULTISPECIES: hypothetical protein [Xenorhabdus]KLU14520.1 hypothetical protein AAY47_15780 [Xenorhabdus griffiniae]KOP33311.1 hypothetical protein AFK69_10060 [Xenorhabdus sp. GDc328]